MALQRAADAHQRHTHGFDLRRAQPPEQLGPAEGEEAAVQIAGQFVDIGQGDHEAHRLSVIFGDADKIFEDDGLELLADMGNFGGREGHEAPVLRPGIVEDFEDEGGFLLEAGLVDPAGDETAVALGEGDDALDHFGERPIDAQAPAMQILDAGIAARGDEALVIGQMVAHHDGGRLIEALHEQARLVPYGQAEGALRAGHAVFPEPGFGGFDQGIGNSLIVNAFEHAPMAQRRVNVGEHELIDLCRDAANRLAIAQRQPEGGRGMAEPGVAPLPADERLHFGLERRHPVGIVFV